MTRTICPKNVVDVESYLLKIQGDRDGWRARQRELKRDVAEMVRRDWPDIDAEPPTEAPPTAAGDGQTAGE